MSTSYLVAERSESTDEQLEGASGGLRDLPLRHNGAFGAFRED
jgi:hypothetical protein